MTSPFLRRLRIVFSAVILFYFIYIYIDFRSLIPPEYIKYLLYLQFIPSIIKFIDIKTLAAGGFLIVLLLTLITGRTYCSFLCPLGIGQDVFSRIGGTIRKRFRRFGYKRPHTVIRYSILVMVVAATFIWGIYFLNLLDPYSIFGRSILFFIKPAVLLINNFAAGILGKFDNYTLHHTEIRGYNLIAYAIPSGFFLLIGLLSLTKGRLYCNMICPVGTFLGLLSRLSLFRIKSDESKCTRCGRCSVVCKSSCIDFLNHEIDVSRCVNCFDCVYSCPDKAISYGFIGHNPEDQKTDESKRKFIAGSIMMLFGLSASSRAQERGIPVPKRESTVREEKNYPVCPPGAGSIRNFNNSCTACGLCISVCPNDVLHPSVRQYGLEGFMQPVMDYHKGFCQYNCTLCTEICPTYALKPLLQEAKKLTQIGKVVFIKDNCIVKTEKTACGACSEACPTKAVFMIPYEGTLLIPDTNQEICIGCGHCEYSCPTVPYKAIFVDGNPVHQVSKKPEIQKPDIESPQDFPF
jgi:polyferredoxin